MATPTPFSSVVVCGYLCLPPSCLNDVLYGDLYLNLAAYRTVRISNSARARGFNLRAVQTGHGVQPASCMVGTGSVCWAESGRYVTTTHPHLVPRLMLREDLLPLFFSGSQWLWRSRHFESLLHFLCVTSFCPVARTLVLWWFWLHTLVLHNHVTWVRNFECIMQLVDGCATIRFSNSTDHSGL